MSLSSFENPDDLSEMKLWLNILQDAYLNGKQPDAWPDATPDAQNWKMIAEDLLAIHKFIRQIADGDLASNLIASGDLAGNLNSLQANLRQLTWQADQVAAGDLTQHVEVFGELASSLNQVIQNLLKKETELLESEAHYRLLSEAMSKTAAALNSAKNLDEILYIMLDNIGNIIPHDSVSVLTVDASGVARVKSSAGFQQFVPDAQSKLNEVTLLVDLTPNLRIMRDNREPYLIHNLSEENWIDTDTTRWAKSHLGNPIIIKGKVAGFLILLSASPVFFKDEHVLRLQTFTDLAAVAIEKSHIFEQLDELSTVDSLTGIANRRHFFNLTEQEITRAVRYKRPLAALMLDVDNFKQINDSYGYGVGDDVLVEIARRCQHELRSVDLIGRYGGEEFSFVLPETDGNSALVVADRLQKVISSTPFSAYTEAFKITVSIGVTGFNPSIPSARALLDQADQALYRAKQSGRNKVAKLG